MPELVVTRVKRSGSIIEVIGGIIVLTHPQLALLSYGKGRKLLNGPLAQSLCATIILPYRMQMHKNRSSMAFTPCL
tara:strand:- start:492 stop:719 length:228 start_codon:yes stop_codon:yes gene_type:complete